MRSVTCEVAVVDGAALRAGAREILDNSVVVDLPQAGDDETDVVSDHDLARSASIDANTPQRPEGSRWGDAPRTDNGRFAVPSAGPGRPGRAAGEEVADQRYALVEGTLEQEVPALAREMIVRALEARGHQAVAAPPRHRPQRVMLSSLHTCVKIALMDMRGLGQRLARAREDAGMTQQELGRMVGLDRTAITRLEAGDRKLSVPELVEIAETLGRPLAHFVSSPVPAVVSRRSDVALGHGTSSALDAQLDDFATDVRTLMEMRLLRPVQRPDDARISQDHQAAEGMASSVRRGLDLGTEAIGDLGRVCERLGLLVYSAPLGHEGPDGACVEVDEGSASLGASVINGEAPLGRRRMTLAHELGHWLSGDAYDSRASGDAERMINSFAIHFLAPRTGVVEVWAHHSDWSTRDRALAVGAAFRLSWSAVVGQLSNIQLIDQNGYRRLRDDEPRYGDYVQLGLSWTDELGSPYLSPDFAAVCVSGYASGRLTSDRALQLLRGTLTIDGLPRQDPPSVDDLRRSFAGHGGR